MGACQHAINLTHSALVAPSCSCPDMEGQRKPATLILPPDKLLGASLPVKWTCLSQCGHSRPPPQMGSFISPSFVENMAFIIGEGESVGLDALSKEQVEM